MSRRPSLLARRKESPPDPPALMALFYVALAVLSSGVAVIVRDGHPFTHPLPWLRLGEPASLGLSLGLGLALAGLVVLSARWSVARFAWARRLQGDLRSAAGSLRLWQVVALASLSSLAEELFFRSLLAPAAGLLLSSLAFGLVHQVAGASRWWWAGWAGMVGLGLGAIFVLTGSLVGPLVAHALINGCNLIFLRDSQPPPGGSPLGGLFAARRDSARVRG